MSQFPPLLKRASFFEAAWAVVESSLSLRITNFNQVKLAQILDTHCTLHDMPIFFHILCVNKDVFLYFLIIFNLLTDMKREAAEKELQDASIASKTREEELELEVERLKEQAAKSDRERIKIKSELDQKMSEREEELEFEVNRLKEQAVKTEREMNKLKSELDQKLNEMLKTKEKLDKDKFQLVEEIKLMKIDIESSESEVEKKSKEIIQLQQDLEHVKCDKLRLVKISTHFVLPSQMLFLLKIRY